MSKRNIKHENYLTGDLYQLLGVFIFFSSNLLAQSRANQDFSLFSKNTSASFWRNDSIESIRQEDGKNYWLPVIEVVGLNLTVNAYNNYLLDENFAKISWQSIKNNLETGFVWDEDSYIMNQFLHPFNGAAYYNSARSNGLTFWEAIPYTFGGSLMWELFLENEPPSYNDLVNTTFSGITLGEISYRVSNLIIDESTGGIERVLREFTSSLINPMRGFNRLISGRMWSRGPSSSRENYQLVFSTGVHNVFYDGNIKNDKSFLTLRLNLEYGNKFAVSKHKNPFDYFSLHTEFNFADGDDIKGIFASGVIWDEKIKLFDNSKNILGIYKDIDILINDVYKLSSTSVTGQIINTVPLSPSALLENDLSLSAIILGATNSKYANEEGKDYNLGPGASGRIGAKIIYKNIGEMNISYKRYWIHTLSGAKSDEFVGLLMTGITHRLYSNSYVGLEFLMYERHAYYEDYNNYSSSNTALRLYIRYVI